MSVGIIAEFNPLHYGHIHLIKNARKLFKDEVIVVALSGNFTQRGEASIAEKFERAKWCLANGVDLVIEIPVCFVAQAAYYFALGGVSVLSGCGIDKIIFGSESGKMELLKRASSLISNEKGHISNCIKDNLKKGKSYPTSMNDAFKDIDVSLTPNNILGIQYIRVARDYNFKIDFYTIKRAGCGYYDKNVKNNIASASYIRELIHKNKIDELYNLVPFNVFNTLKKCALLDYNTFYSIFRYRLIVNPVELSEGLNNRFKKFLFKKSYDDFLKSVITKRYTHARIRREILRVILGLDNNNIEKFNKRGAMYLRVLAMNRKGGHFLKKMAKLPVITTYKTMKFIGLANNMFSFDRLSEYIYYFMSNRYGKYNFNFENV